MSKTRKRVLSVLAILFAAALVFTACLALTGCGDSEEEGGTGSTEGTGTTWPVDWTEYKFNGTQADDEALLYLESDGTIWFGTEAMRPTFEEYGLGGTTGWWGYIGSDLTFVKKNGDTSKTDGCQYSACEMATSGSSVTIGFLNGSGDTCVATIDDIGCLAGKTGYDFTTLEDWDADNNLYQYAGILTA